MSYSSDVLALSPLAYWRLNDNGSTLADSSGNGRDGAYTGTVTQQVTGIPGSGGDKAVTFPGTAANYAAVTNGTWMNRTSDLFIGIWFKTTATGNGYMLQKWSGAGGWGLDMQSSNVFRGYARIGSTNRVLSATVTGKRDGNWHFLALNFTGTTLKLYLDGTEIATGSFSGSITYTSDDIAIARRDGLSGDYFNGTLDEAMVGPAITPTQIANLYTSGSTPGSISNPATTTTETDAAQPFGKRKSKVSGVVAETDAAQPITRVKRYAVGTALETDAGIHITRPGIFLPTSETDTAQPFGRVHRYTIGTATETDGPQSVAKSKRRAVGITAETDAAQLLKRTRPYVIGTALETDAAQQITQSGIIARIIGTAIETDTAQSVGVVQYGGDIPDDPPIEPEPDTLVVRPLRIMASALPAPNFVDGRPA